MKIRFHSRLTLCALLATANPTLAADPPEPARCATVRLATPGWSDIDATNALLSVALKALGYRPVVQSLSVPLIYQGLRSGQLDAFLGNWMPAQKDLVEPLFKQQRIERLGLNLENARFTLAVPAYAAAAGIRSFADLKDHADAFSRRIYGIEAGAPANQIIKRMIENNAFGLGDWKLVESSDSGLLSQLGHDIRSRKMVAFLAWEPHIVNTRFPINYLKGGDAWFGPDSGSATVATVTRQGYRDQCPNAARLLTQLKFSVELENEMIRLNVEQRMDMDSAARSILAKNPKLLATWLANVRTLSGEDGLTTVRKALGQ